MEPIEQLSHILPTLSATVARIQTGQLNGPTPCDKFTVHDVLDHMIVLGGTFAYLFRGEEPPELKAPKVDGRVPAIEFSTVMEDLLDAVRTPGAMERIVSTPVGEMPGAAFAGFVAFDGLMHGWDLARATGLDFELPSAVIASVDAFARGAIAPEMRDGDTFKEATSAPENAGPMERLAAFSGRSV